MTNKPIEESYKYYTKKAMRQELGTVALMKLMSQAYDKRNRLIIGAYFFYNPTDRINNYLFRELKAAYTEYKDNYKNKGTSQYKHDVEMKEHVEGIIGLNESKKEVIKEIQQYIDHYGINLSWFCKRYSLNYQVIYRTVKQVEYTKMSLEKLNEVLRLIDLEVHK